MKLQDFFYKDAQEKGAKMPIPLLSGEDSGEWLLVRGPDSDSALQASRAYTAAYRAVQDELSDLEQKCEASGDYSEYNEAFNARCESLNVDYAAALVAGWSMEDKFSAKPLRNLLTQYKQLPLLVIKAHADSREKFDAK